MGNDFAVPDRMRPVLGVRQFIVNTETLQFFSPNRGGGEWKPREIVKAECIRIHGGGKFGRPFDQNHQSPSELCNCGLYAGYDFPSLWHEGTVSMTQCAVRNNPVSAPLPDRSPLAYAMAGGGVRKCAYGLVALSGDIIYCEKVMQASRAMIVALAHPPQRVKRRWTTDSGQVWPHGGLADPYLLNKLGATHDLRVEDLDVPEEDAVARMAKLADRYNCDYVRLEDVLSELHQRQTEEEENV